ncbi:MAG: biotin--[acetyl-CoA-carboxylase] ligase [Kiritimatiellaeota bacterium]|nr:biotin--[acetyl-CoA-carboxylase] ligase [Kiritimatiellota bacterium]
MRSGAPQPTATNGAAASLPHGLPPAPATPATLGRPLIERDVVTSTNDELKRLAADGAPEGTTVVARCQTHGRGQQSRRWHSPPDLGLYLSVLLRPPWRAGDSGSLALLAGLAVASACDALGVQTVRLKWPNDVLAGGRKIGGVLVEPTLRGAQLEYAVIGLGVNVLQTAEDFPPELRATATSCRLAGVATDGAAVRAAMLRELNRWYEIAKTSSLDQLYSAWAERARAVTTTEHAVRQSWKATLRRGRPTKYDAHGKHSAD